jgi:hypothetical protein
LSMTPLRCGCHIQMSVFYAGAGAGLETELQRHQQETLPMERSLATDPRPVQLVGTG